MLSRGNVEHIKYFFFLYYKCLCTYYPSCFLSDQCLYDTGEHFVQVVNLVFNPIVYILQYNMFKLITKTNKNDKETNNGQESTAKMF